MHVVPSVTRRLPSAALLLLHAAHASTHMCVEAKALPPYHSHHQVARHAAFVMATNEVLSNAIRGSKCNIPQERGLGGMGEGHE